MTNKETKDVQFNKIECCKDFHKKQPCHPIVEVEKEPVVNALFVWTTICALISIAFIAIALCSCSFAFTFIHTEGTSTDVLDQAQDTSPDLQLSIPGV